MTIHRPRRTSRLLAASAVGAALLATACGPTVVSEEVAVAEPVPVPPDALVDPPQGAPGGGQGQDGEAQEVTLRDDVEQANPVPWDSTSYRRDTNEVTVRWTSGVEPCTVTADVKVEYLDDRIEVTVFEGAPPEAATTSCIMMAVQKQYTIELGEDLGERQIVDGAK